MNILSYIVLVCVALASNFHLLFLNRLDGSVCSRTLECCSEVLPPSVRKCVNRTDVARLLGHSDTTILWKGYSNDVYLKVGVTITYDPDEKMVSVTRIK
jgi:hypothetical protein